MYDINLWGSKPGTNDDCWTGISMASRTDALAAFHDLEGLTSYLEREIQTAKREGCELWIEISGPDEREDRCISHETEAYRARQEAEERAELQQRAMDMGMGLGIDAYNDAMGY